MAKYKNATTIQGNNNFLEDSGYIITSPYPTPKKKNDWGFKKIKKSVTKNKIITSQYLLVYSIMIKKCPFLRKENMRGSCISSEHVIYNISLVLLFMRLHFFPVVRLQAHTEETSRTPSLTYEI